VKLAGICLKGLSMSVVTIVYYSGYGHTAKQAEAVAEGIRSASATAKVYRLTDQGDLPEGMTLEDIGQTDAIIYGSPTYMGGPAWQFKKFADACSKLFEPQAWKDKLAAGFTNSASVSGDKSSTITYFWTLAMQMAQIWVGTGLLPASKKSSTPADINWSSGFGGAHAVSPADASVDEAPRIGDLETAKLLGRRVAELAKKLS
jgi:NAD(P)H dehydrogenase (quinone)